MNAAYDDSAEDLSEDARRSRRVRFELIFGSVWLAIGLFVLPAAVYMVGAALLGPYGEKAGLSTFYADFFGDLSEGSGRAWALALGPLVLIYLIRAVFIGVKAKAGAEDDPSANLASFDDDAPKKPVRRAPAVRKDVKETKEPKETKRATTRASRVEPRVGN